MAVSIIHHSEYRPERGPFVGCPNDADRYAQILLDTFAELPATGAAEHFYYWKRDYEGRVYRDSGHPDQHRIQKTSDPEVNPVFIVFAETIGSPVAPPPEGWERMRQWLDGHGFPYLSLLGEDHPDHQFDRIDVVPDGTVPMTGTLFELFEQLRTEDDASTLRVFHVDAPRAPPASSWHACQRVWLDRVLGDLQVHRSGSISVVADAETLQGEGRLILYWHLKLGQLDPIRDPLPGLEARGRGSGLPGRAKTIDALERRIRIEGDTLIPVLGVSGAGKSSLLSAGLLGEWFPADRAPRHPELHALLVEPRRLVDSVEGPIELLGADPLPGLARALEQALLPRPIESVPVAPALTGDVESDLEAALTWWCAASAPLQGRRVLIVDQAEQIEAFARRAARAAAEARGEPTPEHYALGGGWWRLAALLALLAGQAGRAEEPASVNTIPERLFEQAYAHLSDHPTSVVLGLHRESALERWPLDRVERPPVFRVEPLYGQEALKEVICRILGDYGLTPSAALLKQMLDEAVKLATVTLEAPRPDGTSDDDLPKHASVLPQLITALGLVIEHWANERGRAGRWSEADRRLDQDSFKEQARIDGAIGRLGERAWQAWTPVLAKRLGIDPRGYFSARTLEQNQVQRFGALMQRLVDAAASDRKEPEALSYLRRDGVQASRYVLLVSALRDHRLLTSTDEIYFRLPHRSILEHWARARDWIAKARPRLEYKARLRNLYNIRATYPDLPWTADDHEAYAALAVDWIGGGEGEDGELQAWLKEQLLERLDSALIDVRGDSARSRLPFAARAAGDAEWAEQLIKRSLRNDPDEHVRVQWLIACAEDGETADVNALLGEEPTEARKRANAVHDATGTFALLMAAQNGHTESVQALLAAGAEVERVNETSGTFALLQAAQAGHIESVQALLAAGAEVERVHETNGTFALLMAAKNGHTESVQALLAAGAEVERVHETNGTFALLMAAQNGHTEIVQALLAAGAEVERVHETSGTFALLMAAQNGHTESVQALLAAGAEVERVNETSGTFALLMAAQAGHTESVQALLAAGAEVERVNETSGTFALLMAAQAGHTESVQALLAAGAEVERVNETNGTFALLMAAQNGHTESVQALLAAGAEVERVDPIDGTFALLMAAKNGHTESVQALLAAGAEVERVHETSGTFALLMAAQAGHTESVQALLAAGAEVPRSSA